MAQTAHAREEFLDLIADDIRQKHWLPALKKLIKVLANEKSVRANRLFVKCIKHIKDIAAAPPARHELILFLSGILADAFAEGWARPSELSISGIRFLYLSLFRNTDSVPKFDDQVLTEMAGSRLLLQMLVSDPICDEWIEEILTHLRQHLLQNSITQPTEGIITSQHLHLYCALAQQCFINEYVYAITDAEHEEVSILESSLSAALLRQNPVSILNLIAVAAYIPLHEIKGIEQLDATFLPEPVRDLLKQQVSEPLQEIEICNQIAQLTPITNDVSRMVESHYQENPYPRWTKIGHVETYNSLDEYFISRPHLANYTPNLLCKTHNILVAGCGTGQHSIETALRFPGANVLAIDLSDASLSYALRMSKSLSLHNLKHAKADILMLDTTGFQFDYIESVGVLHHLSDPDLGWRALLQCLRTGGVMRIGLYSQHARQAITQVHSYISEKGYIPDPDGIRFLRQDLKLLSDYNGLKSVLRFSDFYSMSGCRDLLFHQQETCYNLLQIQTWIEQLGLKFIGFHAPNDLIESYRQEYPEDWNGINLPQWNLFEKCHPEIFASMYQFWVQKS